MWIKHRSVKNTFFEMYLHFLEVMGAYFASSHRKFFKNLHNRIYLAIFAKIFISTIINLIKNENYDSLQSLIYAPWAFFSVQPKCLLPIRGRRAGCERKNSRTTTPKV